MIRFIDVFKVYDNGGSRVAALSRASLQIAKGEFVALTGPSGCGKSTVLNLMGGIDRPTAGEVWVDGLLIGHASDRDLSRLRRDRVGIVYQFYNLLPTLSAWENVALPALLRGASADEARAAADRALASVGLEHRAAHWPHRLSGGEAQRVAIARAIVNEPAILLADEPTGNLDSKAGAQVLALLRDLCVRTGRTVVLATHSAEAAALADRALHLRDGMLIPHGGAPGA